MRPIILFDIDGTLIDKGNYPENFNSIKTQIEVLKENNFIIGICTFRPLDYRVKKIIKDYSLNGPTFTEGGACLFRKKAFKYTMINKEVEMNLTILIKDVITKFIKDNDIKTYVKVSSKYKHNGSIVINKYRKKSSTIRVPEALDKQIDLIIDCLKNNPQLSNMNITYSHENNLKINVLPKDINKISVIEKYYKKKQIIYISDFEEDIPAHNPLIKIYSVGIYKDFNKKCDIVFSPFGKGVEEILLKLRREI